MRLFNVSVILSNYWKYSHSAYEWTKNLFSRLLGTWFITKQITAPETILSKSDRYIDVRQTRFLSTFEKKGKLYSSNIEPCYYNKTEMNETLAPVDNNLEVVWKRRVLFETTPRGIVSMYYDPYKMAFSYYADSTSIPYTILNAVAMKYCVIFFCRDLFMDDEITPDASPSPLIRIHQEESKKTNHEKGKNDTNNTNSKKEKDSLANAPFARFKNYSKGKPKLATDNEPPIPVKTYHRNRFICVGKLVNMQLLQPIQKKMKTNGFSSKFLDDLRGETSLQKEVMSYKDFKRSQVLAAV